MGNTFIKKLQAWTKIVYTEDIYIQEKLYNQYNSEKQKKE